MGNVKRRLPTFIALVGVALATSISLFPRWDRRWRARPEVAHEGADVIRAFVLTGPPEPDDIPKFNGVDELGVTQWDGSRIYSLTTTVRWAETIGVWVLVAAPFCFAGLLLR